MKKNNYKVDVIQEIGPKFIIQPYKLNKFQLEQTAKTMSFDKCNSKNPKNFVYAQKFMKIQTRPSSSFPQSSKQVPQTTGVRGEQPKNMAMMGSFFVNTRPNTRRLSNSLANYHAQLKRKSGSEHKNDRSPQRLDRKESSQKNINKKTSADILYQNVINDMNQYFSLVKLSSYKRSQKKNKPALKPAIKNPTFMQTNVNKTNLSVLESPITEKKYMSTEIRSRKVQPQQYTNMNIISLKPNNIRFSHNARSQSYGSKQGDKRNDKTDLAIKLVTQQFLFSPQKSLPKNRVNIERQALKRAPKTAINSPKKSQVNFKKRSSYLMQYFGKVKDITTSQQIQRFKALYYRDLIWKIWYNSGWKVKIQSYSNSSVQSPRYFVGRGNNSKLVKMIIGKRWWWKLQSKQQNANFLWTQLKIYSAYQSQIQYQPVNVFQNDDQIIQSARPQTQKNFKQQEQQVKISQFNTEVVILNKIQTIEFNLQIAAPTYQNFTNQESKKTTQPVQQLTQKLNKKQLTQTEDSRKLKLTPIKIPQKPQFFQASKVDNLPLSASFPGQNNQIMYDEQWCNNKLKINDKNVYLMTYKKYKKWESYIRNINNYKRQAKSSENLETRKNFQKNMQILDKYPNKVTNHLQYSRLIGNKKALYKTLSTYYQMTKKLSRFLPMTYHITSGLQDQEYLKFLNQYYRRSKQQNNSMWIVKPGQMSNRGCGIKVCQDIQQIKKILKNKKVHTNGKPFTYIIQQYIRQPFLYQGRKFDIRHYIMINSTFGRIKGYFYEQGYIRTTSYKYSLKNQDSSIHLTNDAVQKYCKQYGKYEKGNKLSYQQFDKYLKTLPDAKEKQYNFFEKILPKIRQISIDVINSSYYIIDPKRKGNNFEVFGLDIMIDSQFRPWLIEVNTNPCLQLSSPVLAKVIPKMLDNAFAVSLDPLFPPPSDVVIAAKKNNLPQNYIIQNKFQLVFDEVVQGKKINRLYKQIQDQLSQMQGYGSDQQAYESAEDDFDAEC